MLPLPYLGRARGMLGAAQIYQVGLCKFLKMIWGLTLNGKDFPEGVSSARMEALQETMHRLHEGNAPDQVRRLGRDFSTTYLSRATSSLHSWTI